MGKRKRCGCRNYRLPLNKGVIRMNQLHYTHIHPGEVLKDELEEVGLTQSALAKHIGVLPKTINEICRGKRGISAEMAVKLSKALGGSPQFWLNLQNNWEISQIDETAYETIKKVAA
jgi:addiction module HigA family antidote